MKDNALSRQLQRIVPPAANPLTRERARMRALAAFRESDNAPEDVRLHWPAWLFAIGAAAAVVMLALRWHAPSVPSPEPSFSNAALLAQMERSFPGELDAVIERGGQFKLALATHTTRDSDQPLLVEFRRGNSVIRVLSFSGRHVCVDLGGAQACFEALVDERGNVIVAGEDFVGEGNQSIMSHGWKIVAQSLPSAG